MSGPLSVTRHGGLYYLDFPSRPVVECGHYSLEKALGVKPDAVYKAADFLILVNNETVLRNINPDLTLLIKIKDEAGIATDSFGYIVTARGTDCDFVSRFFAPNAGVDEDHVTGRAHCSLTPFWAERLNKNELTGKQLSKRGGVIYCHHLGGRVKIGGNAVMYLKGEIHY
jgi:predicted PhzF superfamily epimerase YddE/YHI9